MSANVSIARELAVGATTEPIVAWRAWALTGHRDGTELLLRVFRHFYLEEIDGQWID